MRRKAENEANGNGAGHIKFRVVEFEIDGENNTLAEGIKALTTALSKTPGTTTVIAPQRALAAPTAPTKPLATATVPNPEPPAEPQTEEETTELHEDAAVETATPVRQRRTPSPPPALEALSDIDLNTGRVSLKDFVEQKQPAEDSDYERFATIAVWYKENHNLEEVNANRIYTAYRFLEWVPPTDPAQVLRNLKANKKWFDKGQERGGYKVNMLGLNAVLRGFGA